MNKRTKDTLLVTLFLVVSTIYLCSQGFISAETTIIIASMVIMGLASERSFDKLIEKEFIWLTILLSAIVKEYFEPMKIILPMYEFCTWAFQLSIQVLLLGSGAGCLCGIIRWLELKYGNGELKAFFLKTFLGEIYKKWRKYQSPIRTFQIISESASDFAFLAVFGKIGIIFSCMVFDRENIVQRNIENAKLGMGSYESLGATIALNILIVAFSFLGVSLFCASVTGYIDPFRAEMREVEGQLSLIKLCTEISPKVRVNSKFEYFWKKKHH